ncbi:cytochrome oxidase assembly protein ShyY1 [Streptomyces sp. Amel2xB2]|uniref:SURF1 family cytochrome oxidase biogenesis protein n=1 Tax=Streptomyces sp. Amel2xB2 TaxID=1305829 RepID=UPI000DBA2E19|nr:SURF1 family protein [Streptomyces sp. Amel2xB2]RAJ65705.1 cytochrome oxidase assembly protein ShyY1 [Streptomyces sp. Amel2xB2]
MYRFLLSRQWVILTLLGLALIPAMIELGFWQLHRHESRVAHNELVASSLAADPVPFGRLSSTRHGPAEDDQFRTVRAKGRFDTAHEVVVRQRTGADEKSIGYFVVTPLVQGDGSAVLVNRGWIEANGDLTRFPDVPPPPRGEVTVTGRIMADETSEASGIKDKPGLPPRQVMLIDSRQQAKALKRPVLRGHLQLTAVSPKPHGAQPERIPEPDHDSIGPHMAYAVQWWLFAAAVPVGWVVLVRRERQDRTAREDGGANGTGGTGGADDPDGTGTGGAGPRDADSAGNAGGEAPNTRGTDGSSPGPDGGPAEAAGEKAPSPAPAAGPAD